MVGNLLNPSEIILNSSCWRGRRSSGWYSLRSSRWSWSGTGARASEGRLFCHVYWDCLPLHPHPIRHPLLALVEGILYQHVGRETGCVATSTSRAHFWVQHVLEGDQSFQELVCSGICVHVFNNSVDEIIWISKFSSVGGEGLLYVSWVGSGKVIESSKRGWYSGKSSGSWHDV